MTESEWASSTDAGAMLDFVWQQRGIAPHHPGIRMGGVAEAANSPGPHADLERALHRYYLESCRRIWPLLLEEGSREGVEMGEGFLNGQVSAAALQEFTWHTDAAAFAFDYQLYPDDIAPFIAEVSAMQRDELRSLLNPPEVADDIDPRELLKRAAYFADYSMIYPSLRPEGPPPDHHRIFLSADLLRQHVTYPATSTAHP